MTVAAPFLVRTLVLTAAYVVALVFAYQATNPDPLAFGLGLFLFWVVAALVWGLVDGARHPAGRSLLVWLLVAIAMGVIVILGTVIVAGDDGLDGAVGFIVFTVVLIGVPAAIGIGIGALVQRARS